MTISDRVASAWESGVPFALDTVAQEWAAEGRNKTPLYDAIEQLLLDVREAGADDETEDRITGVMNRLTGWCHPSNFIATKGSEPLTGSEIDYLPRWAKVAFAARCARRVLAVFLTKWSDAPEELFAALKYATEVGEWLAARGGKGDPGITLVGAVTCAAYVCDAAYNADRDRDRAKQVIRGTGQAIVKLGTYHNNIAGDVYRVISRNAALALADSIATTRDNYPFAVEYAHSLIRSDFLVVRRLAEQQDWNDQTPVTPEVFGSLSFDGMPLEWSRQLPPPTAITNTHPDATSLTRDGMAVVHALNQFYLGHGEGPIALDDSIPQITEQLSVAV